MLDAATQGKQGGDHSKSNIVTVAPEGNSAAKGLRRLRKDRPDLHEQVLFG